MSFSPGSRTNWLARQVGISAGQESPFRIETQQSVGGERAGGGCSGQMVSLMPITKMAHYHHLVITISGVPPWTTTRMQPLNVPPPPLTCPVPWGWGLFLWLPLYSEHPEPECQRALRGGELPILGDNQDSDDLESLGYRGSSLNYLPKLDPGIFRKYMN